MNLPEHPSPEAASVRREYDRLAPEYDQRWKRYIDATLELVLEELPAGADQRVLDLPCGTGELERRLLAREPKPAIVGVDLSLEMLKRAQAKRLGGAAAWLHAEARRLPLRDGSFDWIVCANSFHYFRSPAESLREMHRVLRPGGQLVMVDWCDDYLVCKLCSLWLRWTDPAFYRTYSLRECQSLLEQAGFRVERTRRTRVTRIWGLMRLVAHRQEDGATGGGPPTVST